MTSFVCIAEQMDDDDYEDIDGDTVKDVADWLPADLVCGCINYI